MWRSNRSLGADKRDVQRPEHNTAFAEENILA
jgi:hypothetical protein